MKIGICDDEPVCIQQLELIISENFEDVEITTYSCGQKMKMHYSQESGHVF